MARLAHPDGEKGIANACALHGALQIISQNASMTPEAIVQHSPATQIFGWQLYIQNDRAKSAAMLARIARLPAIRFIVLTLDAPVPGKREHDDRAKGTGPAGIGAALFWGTAADLTWHTTLPWLARQTALPIVLKGIQTHEDACRAAMHPAVRAIILSNHGGRALDTAPPALHTLLEIRKFCPEVLDRVEVWVDGGIRRGTDVVKALCLGAKGVGVGRGMLWGLGAGGTEGVARTFESMSSLCVCV